LIDDIKRRLDVAETREETVEIFNDAVVKLDNYGLLGGLSVEQTQRLVNGEYQKTGMMDSVKRGSVIPLANYDNWNCSIQGMTDRELTTFYFKGWFIEPFLAFIDNFPLYIQILMVVILLLNALETVMLWYPVFLLRLIFPFTISSDIDLGEIVAYDLPNGSIDNYPCTGSIWTLGDNGTLLWDGEFYGNIKIRETRFDYGYRIFCEGVEDFCGIKLFTMNNSYFLGQAKRISLSREPPPLHWKIIKIEDEKPKYHNIYENMGKEYE
jgi:hypothetical protein